MISRLCVAAARPVLAVMAALVILASLTGVPYAREGAITAAVAAVALQFTALTRMARLFCVIAVAAFLIATRMPPARFAEVQLALWQGVGFATLLSMLGVLRAPVKRSRLVAGAASYLAAFPARRRYGAINVGSHFLSLLFNVGVIPLIGTFLKAGTGGGDVPGLRHMLLAGFRGSVLTTVWSPMSLGFAITTTAVVGLDPVLFLAAAFASAMALLALTLLILKDEAEGREPVAREGTPAGSPGALYIILLASAGLLAAAILVHEALGQSFMLSTVIVLPVFAGAWSLLERGDPHVAVTTRMGSLFSGLGDLRTEAAIFLSANVIGATISAFVRELPVFELLKGGHYPVLPMLMFCLAVVPLAGAAFIPHSILVVLLAQLLGPSPLGIAHPLALGLTLSFGWALGICVSPISAMSLMTGSLAGVPSHVVALSWNRRFALVMFVASAAIVSLAALGGV